MPTINKRNLRFTTYVLKHPVPEPDQIKYYKHHVLLERFKDYIKEICIHDKVNNNALLKLCNVCNIFSLDVA